MYSGVCDSMFYYMSRGYPKVRTLTGKIRNRETFFECRNTVYSLYSILFTVYSLYQMVNKIDIIHVVLRN